MSKNGFGRAVLVVAAIGVLPLAARADEIVHFTNGAEMTVRSHVVEKDKQMVRLDLGANSFISFPMSMVDKIVNAGRDVFLNPVFHPANQAIAGGAAGVAPDNSIRGIPETSSQARRSAGTGRGEASDAVPVPAAGGPQVIDQSVANSRRVFNPAVSATPGAGPQVIMPPGKRMPVTAMTALPPRPPDAPPAPTVTPEPQENPPAGDPDPENPPDAP